MSLVFDGDSIHSLPNYSTPNDSIDIIPLINRSTIVKNELCQSLRSSTIETKSRIDRVTVLLDRLGAVEDDGSVGAGACSMDTSRDPFNTPDLQALLEKSLSKSHEPDQFIQQFLQSTFSGEIPENTFESVLSSRDEGRSISEEKPKGASLLLLLVRPIGMGIERGNNTSKLTE